MTCSGGAAGICWVEAPDTSTCTVKPKEVPQQRGIEHKGFRLPRAWTLPELKALCLVFGPRNFNVID